MLTTNVEGELVYMADEQPHYPEFDLTIEVEAGLLAVPTRTMIDHEPVMDGFEMIGLTADYAMFEALACDLEEQA